MANFWLTEFISYKNSCRSTRVGWVSLLIGGWKRLLTSIRKRRIYNMRRGKVVCRWGISRETMRESIMRRISTSTIILSTRLMHRLGQKRWVRRNNYRKQIGEATLVTFSSSSRYVSSICLHIMVISVIMTPKPFVRTVLSYNRCWSKRRG